MTDGFTQSDGSLADRLTAACGASDLAAAAAIDAEEGDEFLHARLADQMAGAHLLTMRMAALADRAVTAAAEGVGQGGANVPLYDFAAARFAGAAARLNGRYCRSLQTLRALAGPAAEEEDVQWIGLSSDPEVVSLEEQARRITRAESYRRLHARGKPSRASDPERPQADPAEQARLAAAEQVAHGLLTETGLDALASSSHAQNTELFAHQLAATHRLVMRLTGRADVVIAAAADPLDRPEGLRLAHGAARLMERFRQGVAMLHRLRTTPDRPRPVDCISTDPYSDYERERERAQDIAHGIDPETVLPAEAGKEPTGHLGRIDLHVSHLELSPPRKRGSRACDGEAALESRFRGNDNGGVAQPTNRCLGLLRRGRLKNGNRGGDFLAAPRCGARTRAGRSCRQPAMGSRGGGRGRCRFHGGKSTGPRTAEGLARARRARLVHGLRSAEIVALGAAAAAAHRSLGVLIAAARRKPEAGTTMPEARTTAPAAHVPASDVRLPGPGPAGHGVDRSESSVAAPSAVVLPFAAPAPRVLQAPHRRHRRAGGARRTGS